jgi:hypothetical protein
MIDFECNEQSCPNKDVEYCFLGNPVTAICGGCNSLLTGTNERPDPELPENTFGLTEEEIAAL